jgi:hypothetical protein
MDVLFARGARRATQLSLALAVCALVLAPGARGRSYTVVGCDAAPGGAHHAWRPSSNSSAMRLVARCPSLARADRGLRVTVAGRARSRVPYATSAEYRLATPRGTALERAVFSAHFVRRTSGWRVGVESNRGFIAGCPAGPGPCPPVTRASSFALRGARWVRLVAVCLLVRGCLTHHGRSAAVDAHLLHAAVRVTDEGAPQLRNVGGRAVEPRWHRGTEALTFQAFDPSGVKVTAATVNGHGIDATRHLPCDYARSRPCPDVIDGSYALRTASDPFVDGRNVLAVTAVDAAGNVATFQRDVYVDNHAPGQVSGFTNWAGEGWRAQNRFTLTWANPGGQVAPIVAARYRLCAVGLGCLPDQRVVRADISRLDGFAVPWAGDWTLRLWLEDAAGNSSVETRSAPVALRFDDLPPRASFEPPDPHGPRRVQVDVADVLSGVAGGEVQIRRRGAPDWTRLSTRLERGHLISRIDDRGAPAGTYELRAIVRDAAGNYTISDRRTDGDHALLQFPLRLETRLEAGVARRRGHRARHALRVPFGRRAVVTGLLRTQDGRRAVAGEAIQLVETPRGAGRPRVTGFVRTSASGRFRYRVAPGPSRRIDVRYHGSETTKPAVRTVFVLVPASSTLHVSRRRVLNGQGVAFSGRLRGGHVPGVGKLIALQAHVPGRRRWLTFATPRTSRGGRWSSRYRFVATRGVVRYRFRAVVPREAGYPFEEGHSRAVAVTVRGR